MITGSKNGKPDPNLEPTTPKPTGVVPTIGGLMTGTTFGKPSGAIGGTPGFKHHIHSPGFNPVSSRTCL